MDVWTEEEMRALKDRCYKDLNEKHFEELLSRWVNGCCFRLDLIGINTLAGYLWPWKTHILSRGPPIHIISKPLYLAPVSMLRTMPPGSGTCISWHSLQV
jgi:hypothetical protein